jgi:hypothetical protein
VDDRGNQPAFPDEPGLETDNSIFRRLERFDFSITRVVMATTFFPHKGRFNMNLAGTFTAAAGRKDSLGRV